MNAQRVEGHTPTPWELDYDTRPAEVCTVYHTPSYGEGNQRFVYIRGPIGYWSATDEENLANAKFIVHACNNIERLEKVNEALVRALETIANTCPDERYWKIARDALAKEPA